MPVRRNAAPFTPDSHNLTDAVDTFVARNKGDFTYNVGDLVNEYGRDELAERLAEMTGTKVKSQKENIRRWLNYENGTRGSQARDPEKSRKTIGTLNELREELGPKRPDKRINVRMSGTFKVSNDVRLRDGSSAIDIDIEPEDLDLFLDAMAEGDLETAYGVIFDAYGTGGMEAGNDVRIDLSY